MYFKNVVLRRLINKRKLKLPNIKDMIEKLNTACLGVKLTLDNIPKIVERLE